MSPIHLYTSHVSYTFTHESCLLYIHICVPSIIHLYMSHVFHTFIYESCLLYIYIWVMSPIHIYMSRVSHTSIYESWLSPETLLPNRDMCMCNKVNTCVDALSAISTISLSYVCVQHVVDRCVCRVERYVHVQQSKHECVSISPLCLLYLCHMWVCSTSSTGACVE